jgi:ABC-type taurine transport system ATPase subunit
VSRMNSVCRSAKTRSPGQERPKTFQPEILPWPEMTYNVSYVFETRKTRRPVSPAILNSRVRTELKRLRSAIDGLAGV